jgi:hypothetical protein
MSTLDEVRTPRGTALRLLPSFWQVRGQLDLAIEVLEYFAREAEHELATSKFMPRRPIDPHLAGQIGVLQSMISAFMRLHQPQG